MKQIPPICVRVREIRERLGLSQAELGEKTGVSRDVLSRIERGQVPDASFVGELAKLAKVSCDWLVLGVGPERQSKEAPASVLRGLALETRDYLERLIDVLDDPATYMEGIIGEDVLDVITAYTSMNEMYKKAFRDIADKYSEVSTRETPEAS